MTVRALILLCGVWLGNCVHATPPEAPAPAAERLQALVHMVRQDCASCHGLKLTGGLGPPLTPEALAEMPLDNLAAVIYHGRPGTPMPPWRAMLNETEARWIAERLQQGFPEESSLK